MKNLKTKLKKLAQNWNASGQYDDTEFEGRYFLTDEELDDFAIKHKLCQDNDDEFFFDKEKIEEACDCALNYDYESANPLRQLGDSEIIFNEEVIGNV